MIGAEALEAEAISTKRRNVKTLSRDQFALLRAVKHVGATRQQFVSVRSAVQRANRTNPPDDIARFLLPDPVASAIRRRWKQDREALSNRYKVHFEEPIALPDCVKSFAVSDQRAEELRAEVTQHLPHVDYSVLDSAISRINEPILVSR